MKKYGGVLFCLFILVVQLSACSKQAARYIYQQDKEYIGIKQVKIKNKDSLYKHPFQATPEQLINILDNIYYKHMMLIRYVWSKPKPVFSKRQQELLAVQLSKALDQAGAEEQISFSIIDASHEKKRTNGTIYVDDYGLNIILGSLHEPEYTLAVDAYNLQEARWKFWPIIPEQDYKCLRRNHKNCQKNWLVIKLPNGGAGEDKTQDMAN